MSDLTAAMPSSLKTNARWMRLGANAIPAMVVHPTWEEGQLAPVTIWMHGRTVQKEIDPGRYLRWMRAGIGACALDLPGHGERYDAELQDPYRTLDIVLQMANEIDSVVEALAELNVFDMNRIAIGGMSAGGMATLFRLTKQHPFVCASVEATTGSWMHQRKREMFCKRSEEEIAKHNPIQHREHWREIPMQAIHAKLDEWVPVEGQMEFMDALRERYADASLVETVLYERTGAPNEHAGFGKYAADAKNRQRDFLKKYLF